MRGLLAAACDRLVDPGVQEGPGRAALMRVMAMLLAGPFLLAAAAFVLMPASAGLAVTLAFVCSALGAAWMGVLVVASTAETLAVRRAALVAATIEIAALVAAGGGLASPVSAVVIALPIEAWLICRTRGALIWGAAAALAALTLQGLLAGAVFAPVAASAWHWIVPLAYLATLPARLGGLAHLEREPQPDGRFMELASLIDAVALRFSGNGEVSDVSDASRQVLGLEPSLLVGSGLFDRIHVADRLAYLSALADLRQGETSRKVELRLRLPQDGSRQATDMHGDFVVEFHRAATPLAAITGLLRDNREVAELRRAVAAAECANEKLDLAKSRFLAAVSHELRTPLNSIIGFSDMLLHEMFGGFRDPRQKEYVELVRDSGHHLLEVVNSILDVSKIEAGSYTTNPEPFQFREALDMCQSMMSVQAEAKSIRMTMQASPDVGEIRADRRAVQQILINLVSNAVKFTPKGGSVTIGAKRFGSRLHFWVSDTGIGIADDDLERLGRPFTQVQNDYTRHFEGTGLGLSLVKGLVSLHEGTLTIDSAVGDGTTVTVTLPIDGPHKTAASEGAALLTLQPARTTKETDHGTLRKAG